jgi:uncharacterized SAM-binding protein YcdF (DUF218 family)
MYPIIVPLLHPLLLLMIAQGIGLLWLAARARSHRWLAGWCLAVYALLWIYCTPVVARWSVARLERSFPPVLQRPADAEAIVVLAGGVIPPAAPEYRQQLNDRSLRRCLRAAELYHQGAPCLVVAAGGKVDRSEPGEAEAIPMREMLQRLGVPDADLVVESRSLDTFENAAYVSQILSQRSIRRIVLVTDATHLRRATDQFRRRGLDVIPAASHYQSAGFRWNAFALLPALSAAEVNTAVFRELLGTLWGKLRESRSVIAEALLPDTPQS